MTRLKIFFFTIFISVLLFGSVRPAQAFSFGEVVDGVKSFFSAAVATVTHIIKKDSPKDMTVEANLQLSENDNVVEFSYIVSNPTKQKHKLATLYTNIPRGNLNYIHDVRGTASLADENGTITIPNLLVPSQGEVIISFRARVNYSSQPLDIFTEPELVDQDKKQLTKSGKKSVQAKPKPLPEFE